MRSISARRRICCFSLLWIAGPVDATRAQLPAPPSGVQVSTEAGFEFSLVSGAGNAPFSTGRGGVGYNFRMARTEVSTSQWLQFANVAARDDLNLFFQVWPAFWGASRDGSYTGPGRRYTLVRQDASAMPVSGITWRAAAMFCNWLSNGQQDNTASFMNGAYDVSTFGADANGFTDQITHNTNARFWIPTLDEWIKAVHFDSNRSGVGHSGYWLSANSTDGPLLYGPPGQGQTNAGQGWTPDWRLASYPDQQTPWGLLDASGMAGEWTEGLLNPQGRLRRVVAGSGWGSAGVIDGLGHVVYSWDDIRYLQDEDPDAAFADTGLRIAAAVPAPGAIALALPMSFCLTRRRRSC